MWEIIKTSLPQLLAAGFKYTIPLAIISFFFGLIIALVTALIRLSRQRGAFMILKWIASFYVWLFSVNTAVGSIIYCILWTAISEN